MIDCHTHLTDPSFDADRAAVLARAAAAGVRQVAVVGQDLAENHSVLALVPDTAPDRAGTDADRPAGASGGTPHLLGFLGLHPDRFADSAEPIGAEEQAAILALIREQAGRITGIGEVGLDYWRSQDDARRAQQREALTALTRLALELDLPLNVHSRSAGRHTIDLLADLGARRVLMHAYDGKPGHALRGAEAGFVFSVPPSIVRSPQKRKLVRALPLASLALETDSPVLGPEPGERNEPANVVLSAQAIAEIKGVPIAEVHAVTSANARRVFGLPD